MAMADEVGSAVKGAAGDAVLTFFWVVCASTLGASTHAISTALDLHKFPMAPIAITTTLIAFLVIAATLAGSVLGGAAFNPTAHAAFYAAGLADHSLLSMALRFPAQALGAVGGALAIMELMPAQYKHMLGGPSVKVDMHTGAIAEGVLTFVITFAVLWIVVKGPRSLILKAWLIATATISMVIFGSGYTGPSMNPANAFGWAYVNNRHNTWEQFYVYWISPFLGAILAAWIFRLFLSPPAKKVKKA
ncbi:small and basic intrinsic protein 1A [Wolffia australiana]